MLFVGLDLSLRSTGMACLREDGSVQSIASFGSPLKRGASVKQKIDRLTAITGRIVSDVRAAQSHGEEVLVAIENYAFGARGAQNDLGELHGCVKQQLAVSCGVVPSVVSPSTYRKLLIGSGRTSKAKSFEFACSALTILGIESTNADQADAYLVAEWLRRVTAEE